MKKVTYLLAVLFALALMSMGCEKENPNPDDDNLLPDKNALRISKIADNPAMMNPLVTFEYNAKGLVTEIGGDGGGTSNIIYNDADLPVKIVSIPIDEMDGEIYYGDTTTTDIIWTENSFTLSYIDWSDELRQEKYTLDPNGRIVSIDYYSYEALWEGNEAEIYYVRDGVEEWAQTRQLTENNHPLSALNLAIVIAGDISWIYDECDWVFQNKYCLDNISSADEGSADYTYEYNGDGYPTQLEIYETTEHDTWMYYFEYETN